MGQPGCASSPWELRGCFDPILLIALKKFNNKSRRTLDACEFVACDKCRFRCPWAPPWPAKGVAPALSDVEFLFLVERATTVNTAVR